MKQLIDCLEEEVSLLRELLTNLKIEKNALMLADQKRIELITIEKEKLSEILKKKKDGRKKLSEGIHDFKQFPEIQTLIEQVESLEVHITEQKQENKSLRKNAHTPPGFRKMLKEKEAPKKKRPLLLEDDAS